MDPPELSSISYTPRVPVMETLQSTNSSPSFLKAQITADDAELRDIIKEQRQLESDSTPSKAASKTESTRKKVSRERKPSPRSILPYQAHAHLLPVAEPLLVSSTNLTDHRFRAEHGSPKARWGWESRQAGSKGARPSSRW
jgi:DNA polymerase gamma 1